jgi:hypothetical protein
MTVVRGSFSGNLRRGFCFVWAAAGTAADSVCGFVGTASAVASTPDFVASNSSSFNSSWAISRCMRSEELPYTLRLRRAIWNLSFSISSA